MMKSYEPISLKCISSKCKLAVTNPQVFLVKGRLQTKLFGAGL
jgi:hypothetical protein